MSVMVESSKEMREMSSVVSLEVAVVSVLIRSSTRLDIIDSDVSSVLSSLGTILSVVLNSDILLGLGIKGLFLLLKIRTLSSLGLVLFKVKVDALSLLFLFSKILVVLFLLFFNFCSLIADFFSGKVERMASDRLLGHPCFLQKSRQTDDGRAHLRGVILWSW